MTSWREIAREDLKAAFDLVHLHTAAPHDTLDAYPHFNHWLSSGLQQVSQKLEEVNDYGGYEYLLREYLNGFQEPHLSYHFSLLQKKIEWGRVLVVGDRQFSVIRSERGDVPVGAVVELCNGMPVEVWMAQNVHPWYSLSSLPKDRIQYSSYLFARVGNPWAQPLHQVVFRHKGELITHQVRYEAIDRWSFDRLMGEAWSSWFSTRGSYGVEIVGDVAWIRLPSFLPKGNEVQSLMQIIDHLPKLRSFDGIILFDLRGNGGGELSWVIKIAFSLFTESYLTSIKIRNNAMYAEYRATDEVKEVVQDETIKEEIRCALERGGPLARTDQVGFRALRRRGCAALDNPVKASVAILTDERVGSSSLFLLDILTSIPGTLHVGRETMGDSHLTQAGVSATMPSGLLSVRVPCQVRRNFERRNIETYKPHLIYEGDMRNDEALLKWISGRRCERGENNLFSRAVMT